MRPVFSAFLLSFFVFSFTACSDNSVDEYNYELYKIGDYSEGNYTLIAFADRPLAVGHNILYFELLKDGIKFDHSNISFLPMMMMGHQPHSSPFVDISGIRGESGLYDASVIFTMPGNDLEYWEFRVSVGDDQNGLLATGAIPVDVESSNKVKMFTGNGETRYFVTLIEPRVPKVGINDLTVAVHKRSNPEIHPPVSTSQITFNPWMPAMDHGSSNNKDPEYAGDGMYEGNVNFSMTGDWELRFQIEIEGDVHPLTFEITL
ncbi:MAG: FixH family protein [Balneolales bacterium]